MKPSQTPNLLIHASSPYLTQHAYNPVQWHEWGTDALQLARETNRPLHISIGYSACHWCHVMAHEVFENEESAAYMNTHFVNIKIDREERPDIDQIYMDAVQSLTGRGGWPLTIFALPDGRPFYGGTYFPKKDWDAILLQLNDLWQTKPETVYEYATRLSQGLKTSNAFNPEANPFNENDFHAAIQSIKASWDQQSGGFNRAPKFPLPVVYGFALHYVHLFHDPEVLDWILLSLKRMSFGGLFDTVGGGYARYSVDAQWLAPHFEKMLYDNGQLLGLLADAYRVTGEPFLRDKMDQTLGFMRREWLSPEGGFYSALDADSEGEEGKYYCYTWADLVRIGLPSQELQTYFSLSESGNWEHGKNILFATQSPEEFCKKNSLELSAFKVSLNEFINRLNQERATRVKPGLDDKILVSWNALAITGLLKCFRATSNREFLNTAETAIAFIETKAFLNDTLYRNYKNEKASIPAFLEDYVLLAEALTEAYQCTYKTAYLIRAKELIRHVLDHFSQSDSVFFVFNPDPEGELFMKKTDLGDDVIPSANSVLCELLLKHAFYFDLPEWREKALNMLKTIQVQAMQAPAWHCRWLNAAMLHYCGINQVTVVNTDLQNLLHAYLPNTISLLPDSEIPLSAEKSNALPAYFHCRDFECFAPETNWELLEERLF